MEKTWIGDCPCFPNWKKALKELSLPTARLVSCNALTNIPSTVQYLIPMSDSDYQCMANIPQSHAMILYPSPSVKNLLNNKILFTKFMQTHFPNHLPKVYYLDGHLEEGIPLNNTSAVIMKPAISSNGRGIRLLRPPFSSSSHFLSNQSKGKVIQEFIQEEMEYSAYLLCISGEICRWKTLCRRFDPYFVKTENFPDDPLTTRIDETTQEKTPLWIVSLASIVRHLNYTGGMCVDFKMTQEKEMKIFEINPRFGGSAFTHGFIGELLP